MEKVQFVDESLSLLKDSSTTFLEDVGIHTLIEQQAAQTPDTVALVFDGAHLTYAQLNQRANRLSHLLRTRGIGPEAFVGLCSERCIEMVIALLGIMKAGGTFVPLDPHNPAERLAFVLTDTSMHLLLAQKQFADLFVDANVEVLCLETGLSFAEEVSMLSLEQDPFMLDTLAYTIYTSGSTGKPKGVLIPHSALISHALAFHHEFAIQRSDRVLQCANVSFDIAVEEIFPTLLTGATIVLKPDHIVVSLAAFLHYVEKEQVTIMNLTSSYWHQLVQEMTTVAEPLSSSLRLALVGAEKVSPERLHTWQNIVGDRVRWYNAYGPTEATVTSTCYESRPQKLVPDTSVPIGFPMLYTELYVLDQRQQPVPVGNVGELYISGQRLARGYLHRPDLTAELFLPHPYSSRPGERLYKTGDLVRYLDDGALEFLGRADQQVKLRGFRIELGEIETILARHPSVQETVVALQEGLNSEKHIVAYFTINSLEVPTSQELRTYLQTCLPYYMVPTVCIQLETLPLNRNGKVDVQALPAPNWSVKNTLPESPASFDASPLEELLLSLWHEVLGLTPVSPHANFIELGGDSLLATQLLARIRQTFSIELSLPQFLLDPTFLSMEQIIEAGLHSGSKSTEFLSSPTALPRSAVPSIPSRFPLSFAQQRLWFLEQLQPYTSLYNVPLLLRLDGLLHIDCLQQSLKDIVERHESLRTSFAIEADGQSVQYVHVSSSINMVTIDLASLSLSEQNLVAHQLAEQEGELPFDLGSAPLLRAQLLCLNARSHVLLLTLHHIICDGWSIGILLSELAACYQAHLINGPLSWRPLKVQYADYACWQQDWLTGQRLESQLTYWRTHLAAAPDLLALPTDHPRPAILSSRGATLPVHVPASLCVGLKELAQHSQVTLFMALLASFATLLARYSGEQDLVIGTPIANRQLTESEALIGFFVNTLPLRVDLQGDPSFQELLQRVREVTLQGYAHQDVPLESVVEAVCPRRALSHSPLFQVLFVLQNTPMPPFHFPDLTTHLSDTSWKTSKFDLTLALAEENGALEAQFEYSTDLFEAETIQRLAEHWLTLLAGIVQAPGCRLSALPLVSEAQRAQQLLDSAAHVVPFPEQFCVHELFEQQVERSPDAIALVCGSQFLSYRAVDRLATQLSHLLQQQGVGLEQRVGLCVSRDPKFIIALLAVLKAGGAYVPLDPSYPTERLAFMIEDADICIVVTDDQYQASLPTVHVRVLCLDEVWTDILQQPQEQLDIFSSPDMLCYVIFTSGSTGQPKGVCLQHRVLVNLINWQHMQSKHEKLLQRTIQFSSLVFDPLFQEVFSTLTEGGVLVLPTEQIRQNPESLLTFMDEMSIERIYMPFAALRQLAEIAQADCKIVSSLREILTAGEQLQAIPELRSWLKQQPLCRLYNYYGPSETHVITSYLLDRNAESWSALPPIGRPIANTQLYVLDSALNPMPIGVVGELYAGGLSVGRGYANAPHLTAERFIPDPFSKDIGATLYKTGDLVKCRPDGNIEFRGRADTQVKIRGYRVELGEIEAVLHEHSQVKDCVVIADSQPNGNRLVAYIIEQEGGKEVHRVLREHLQNLLPTYMLPTTYISVTAFPLTPTGKVDRNALLRTYPVRVERESVAESVHPRTDLEQKLLDIWKTTLHMNDISIFDNFFELGGHSLLATRTTLQIRSTVQSDFSLRTLFMHPTIAELADAIVKQEIEQAEEQLLYRLLSELDA